MLCPRLSGYQKSILEMGINRICSVMLFISTDTYGATSRDGSGVGYLVVTSRTACILLH